MILGSADSPGIATSYFIVPYIISARILFIYSFDCLLTSFPLNQSYYCQPLLPVDFINKK